MDSKKMLDIFGAMKAYNDQTEQAGVVYDRIVQAVSEGKERFDMDTADAMLLEQLSEECVELAHAALKLARVLRAQNPTPISREKAEQMLMEETGDVELCLMVWRSAHDMDTSLNIGQKLERWRRRMTDRKE